jgi:glycyl-tRNA synthetase
VTVDFESLDDHAVTVRHRDSMEQERVPIEGILSWFSERFAGC